MIRSLRLANWRSHSETRLEFRKGTNLLVGIMGAGKSSVLEAISFALFGTFPALERRKLKLEDIVRLNENSARVALEFSWEGHTYLVERAIETSKRGASTSAEIFREKALIEHGTSAVNSFIENLISVDYDLFTRAIYSEQNNIDHFLNLDPRKRKQEIDSLLGLDRFETARANLVTVIGRIRSQKEALSSRFNPIRLAELSEKLKASSENLRTLENNQEKTRISLGLARKDESALSSSFNAMKAAKSAFESLEKDAIRLQARMDSLNSDIQAAYFDQASYESEVQKLSSLQNERSSLLAVSQDLENRGGTASKQAGSIDAAIKTAAESKSRADAIKKQLEAELGGSLLPMLSEELSKADAEILAMSSEQASLMREISELGEILAKLAPGLSSCPVCASPLTGEACRHLIEERKKAVSDREARIALISGMVPEKKKLSQALGARIRKASLLSEQLIHLEKSLPDIRELEKRRTDIEIELSKIAGSRDALNKKYEGLHSEIEKLKLQVARAEDLMKKSKELETVKSSHAGISKKLASIRFREAEFEDLVKKLESSRILLSGLESSLKSLETEIRVSKDLADARAEELALLSKMEKDILSLSSLDEQLSIFKNALLDAQTDLRSTLIDAINSAMNEIWPIFYPYRNYHGLRLEVTDKDYVFSVKHNEAWKSLDTLASGGERACAALALRIALAIVLTPRLSWLILDEPTHNLDTEAVEMLSSALQSRVPEVVKQVIVITHDEAFMGSDFASSYRLTRDKMNNGETRTESL